jgi:hypothetical protein
MSLRLTRLPQGRYVIHDSELAIVATEASCMASPCLVGICFDTRGRGWRALERGLVDVGYRPTQEQAIERLLERAAEHEAAREQVVSVLDSGLADAKRTLLARGELPPTTAYALLLHAIGRIEELERQAAERALSAAVNRALPL